MKTLIAAMCVLALAGCASTDSKQQDAYSTTDKSGVESRRLAEAAFEQTGGTLNLVFDAHGNWLKLTSKGTASLTDGSPTGRETALMIAIMRAKRSVAEFMNNDVKSAKTLTRIARSYTRAFQSTASPSPDEPLKSEDDEAMNQPADTENSRQAHRFASTLTERIQDNSSAIIKGAYVSHRSLEDGQVIVEITASRESIGAARQLSGMMRGAMQ
jgi:hypothetical protein